MLADELLRKEKETRVMLERNMDIVKSRIKSRQQADNQQALEESKRNVREISFILTYSHILPFVPLESGDQEALSIDLGDGSTYPRWRW